jgi:hypothetical protein
MSMNSATKETLDKFPMDYDFNLHDLISEVIRLHPPSKYSFGETFGRRLRGNRHGEDYDIVCIDPNRSRYKKVEREKKRKKRKGGA